MFASEKARLRLAGTPMEDNFDLLIGCTSVIHRMVMVTENLKDFKNIEYPLGELDLEVKSFQILEYQILNIF